MKRILPLVLLLGACGESTPGTKDETGRESQYSVDGFEMQNIKYVRLFIDPLTKCHYIARTGVDSAFIPRVDASGKQICGDADKRQSSATQ